MADQQEIDGETRFVRKVLILIAIVGAISLTVMLADLLILVFGSIVIAVLLTSITNPIQRWTKLSRGFALTLSILLVLGTVAGAGALFGTQLARQAQDLGTQIPVAWNSARERLSGWGLELPPLSNGETPSGERQPQPQPQQQKAAPAPEADGGGFGELGQDMVGRVGGLLMTVFGALANTLLVIAGGIYLAAQPKLYRGGLLQLVPAAKRKLAGSAYDHSGEALKLWMLGTFVSMGAVGLVTSTGLWLIGVPSALTLGLVAGILEFVPIVGPIAASVPAILLAFSQSTEMALWTAGLFLVVQQLEGNVMQPIIQRYAVDLPPALLLFSVVAGGFLFGLVGIIFAAPLTVVVFVLVKRLYVREVLDTETSLPHEE